MIARTLLATILMGWSVLASGQISGQFYLEKATFAPGEPIFLYFQVVNDGPQAENLYSADPYSFCSGYQIGVSSDPGATSSCAPLALEEAVYLPRRCCHEGRRMLNVSC